MKIKETIERIPGGMMIVPLIVGAIINTLFPNAGKTFGSFTGALMTGSLPNFGCLLRMYGGYDQFQGDSLYSEKGRYIARHQSWYRYANRFYCGTISWKWDGRQWFFCRAIRIGYRSRYE